MALQVKKSRQTEDGDGPVVGDGEPVVPVIPGGGSVFSSPAPGILIMASGRDWQFRIDTKDGHFVQLEFYDRCRVLIPLNIWNEMVKVGPIEFGSWEKKDDAS